MVNLLVRDIDDLLRTDLLRVPLPRIGDKGKPPPVPPWHFFDTDCCRASAFFLFFRETRCGT